MVFWLLGNLSTSYQKSVLLVFWVLASSPPLGRFTPPLLNLNLLLAGEKEAMHLGVDVPRVPPCGLHRRIILDRSGRLRQRAIGYVA